MRINSITLTAIINLIKVDMRQLIARVDREDGVLMVRVIVRSLHLKLQVIKEVNIVIHTLEMVKL